MDLNQLKAEHPEVYQAAKAEGFDEGKAAGKEDGIAAERKRREALLKFKGKGSAAADIAVEAAIKDGKTYEEALPEITSAAVFSSAGENAPAISTKAPDSGSGANGLTAEDVAAARLAGLTLEEYRQYSPKKEG